MERCPAAADIQSPKEDNEAHRPRKRGHIERETNLHKSRATNKDMDLETRLETKSLGIQVSTQSRIPSHKPNVHDNVLKWLEQTGGQNDVDAGDKRQYEFECTARIGNPSSTRHKRLRSRREDKSSSDSSLLAVPRKILPSPIRRKVKDRSVYKQEPSYRGVTNQQHIALLKQSLHQTSPPHRSRRQDTFEKRARYKTREHRYDPKRAIDRDDVGEKPSPKRKRQKKGDRAKAAKKAGADLIRAYTSNNIGQERLTIRPNIGLGLFKNGRASSPVKRRGLPDLAFSEMDFLQNANRHANIEDDRVSSKWRDAETRKKMRTHDEISTFFKPNRGVLQSTDANDRARSSAVPESETQSPLAQALEAGETSRNAPGYFAYQEPLPGYGRRGNGPGSLSIGQSSHDPTEQTHHGQAPTSAWSSRVTSYVSWYETQRLPIRVKEKLSELQQYEEVESSTVRRQLEDTGIFRNTGIGANTTLQWHPLPEPLTDARRLKPIEEHLLRADHPKKWTSPPRISEIRDAEASQSESRASPSPSLHSDILRRLRRLQGDDDEMDETEDQKQPTQRQMRLPNETCTKPLSHLKQDRGLQVGYQQQIDSRVSSRISRRTQGGHISDLNPPQDRPLSRVQIAKNARLSYPTAEQHQRNPGLQSDAAVRSNFASNTLCYKPIAGEVLQRSLDFSRSLNTYETGEDDYIPPTGSTECEGASRIVDSILTTKHYWMDRPVRYNSHPGYAPPFTSSASLYHHGPERTYGGQPRGFERHGNEHIRGGAIHPRTGGVLYPGDNEFDHSNYLQEIGPEEDWDNFSHEATDQAHHEDYHESDLYTGKAEIPLPGYQFEEQEMGGFVPWDEAPQIQDGSQDQLSNHGLDYYAMDLQGSNLQQYGLHATAGDELEIEGFWRPHRQY